MTSLKEYFLLDPEVIFLNHGSFGATPRPVFDVYQEWQRRLEHQPVQFVTGELLEHLKQARGALAETLHTNADDLVYIPNATFGLNVIARSLRLEPGDEILASNHEYGASDNTWEFICNKTGASYICPPIPLPIKSSSDFFEQFWRGVTERTKVIFLSHITSPTAMRFPVEDVCQGARDAGILTVIDGAHAPGQISIDLEAIGADFYVGNCHKWMLAPKGAGFLYTLRNKQHLVEPLVVSWGWGKNSPYTTDSVFLNNLEWWGTKDPAAYLAVPRAIRFQEEHDWTGVRQRCSALLRETIRRVCDLTGLQSFYSSMDDIHHQMGIAPLPKIEDLKAFQSALYDEYRVEIPCIQWQDHQFLRISVQGYNTKGDIDILLKGLEKLLPAFKINRE